MWVVCVFEPGNEGVVKILGFYGAKKQLKPGTAQKELKILHSNYTNRPFS